MRRTDLAGLEIEECTACDGLWLDKDEPERLASLDVLGKHLLQPIYFDDSRKTVAPGQRRCPREACGLSVLEEVVHRGVHLDVCPRCRGMFLDRWELQKLLED
ncbi:MAG: zf-TFIIB domain-containing protein [Armatimonadetes bacterium]|nr:zf-TFIIB domain-containing protein [Armatimonadota bacterium]